MGCFPSTPYYPQVPHPIPGPFKKQVSPIKEGTTDANVTTNPNMTILFIILLVISIVLAAIAFGAGLFCGSKRVRKTRLSTGNQQQSYNMAEDPPYVEIEDRDDMDTSRVNLAENITSIESIGPLSNSSQHIPGFSFQDRKLPSPPRQSLLSVNDTDTYEEYAAPRINLDAEADMNTFETEEKNTIENGEHHHSEELQSSNPGNGDDNHTPIEDQDSCIEAETTQGVKSTQGVEESQKPADEISEDNVYIHLDPESLIPPEERYKPTIYVQLPGNLREPQSRNPGNSSDDNHTPIEDQDSCIEVETTQGVRSSHGIEESQKPADEICEDNVYNHEDQESLIPPEMRFKTTACLQLRGKISEKKAVEIIEEPGECAENEEEKRKDESVANEITSSSDKDDQKCLELIVDYAGT